MRVFLSAGEASGDAYAAALASRVSERNPAATFEGIGGPRLRAVGAHIVSDSSRWGAIGILESLRVVPRVLLGYHKAKRALKTGAPGLMIPIDFGFVNIKLARHARGAGWKVLYFVPPGSWRRDRQGHDLPQITDAIVTPFSWSAEILNRMGANAHWFGHPLQELIASTGSALDRRVLGVLPGSRDGEISANLRLVAKVLEGWGEPIEFALATGVDAASVRALWQRLGGPAATFTQGDTHGVLLRSRAAIVCSGTATLEAAICRTPSVVVYAGTRMQHVEARLLNLEKRIPYVALPNILLGREAVPEFKLWHAQPIPVRTALDSVWTGGAARDSQLAAFEELRAELGPADAISRAADLAIRI